MSEVTVIDYGAGNLLNVVRALEHCGAKTIVTDKPQPIREAKRLVLPGVGAFGDCMNALRERELLPAILDYTSANRLFLGVCVGMQVMFDVGYEFGEHAGLGLIAGRVTKIPSVGADGSPHKIPHIGWSKLHKPANAVWENTPLQGNTGQDAYFIHSFYGKPTDSSTILADVNYNGLSLTAMVKKGNLYGCQFHPEKSAHAGLALLSQFLRMDS